MWQTSTWVVDICISIRGKTEREITSSWKYSFVSFPNLFVNDYLVEVEFIPKKKIQKSTSIVDIVINTRNSRVDAVAIVLINRAVILNNPSSKHVLTN